MVRPESAPLLLCDLEQKLELLASAGVDRTVVVRFDEERANETAEEFVTRELVDGLDARLVVVGEDFHFGHGRKGNVALLTEMGSVAGFAVDGVALASDGRRRRRRPRRCRRPGSARWSPRARSKMPPPCSADPTRCGARWSPGTDGAGPSSASRRPTSTSRPTSACPAPGSMPDGTNGRTARATRRRCRWVVAPPSTEPTASCWSRRYLLDFAGDLYGEPARLSFVHRLRDELAFDSVDALVAQMGRDVDRTRSLLAVPV